MAATETPITAEEFVNWRTKDCGWTQARAAKFFRVHIRTYQGWEAGRRKSQPGPLRKLMEQAKAKAKRADRRDPAQLSLIEEAE